MKSRKVKAYQAHKRVKAKADLILDGSDSDVSPESYLHDEIEDYNNEKDNELSTDDELIQHKEDSSEEEEVMPITDDEKDETDDDEEKDDSDEDDGEEDENEERGLPNREAWGKRKKDYYSTDFVDEDWGRTYREEDAEAARAEAEEAFAIQKSVYSNIKADNLGTNLFFEGSEESSGEEETMDITSATKQEKMKYLKTETKVLEVCKEFKSAISEFKKFAVLLELVDKKKIRSKNLEKYIRVKNEILSLYCLNLSLYMMFTSSGKNPKYHPVVQRISSFKELLDKLKSTDDAISLTLDEILEKEKLGEEVDLCSESEAEENISLDNLTDERKPERMVITSEKEEKKTKKTKTKHIETENEKQVMALIKEVREEMRKRKRDDSDEDDENSDKNEEITADQDENYGDEKRIISYQIAKNKGLVAHRKKEYRNPRVKHRMKFRKANIRRKGQVRGVVKEIKRYAGEASGINANVVKSVKFK